MSPDEGSALGFRAVSDTVLLAILDSAFDEAPIWELLWEMTMVTDGKEIQVHPPRSVGEVRPVLIQLLREGHVELYRMDDPQAPALSFDQALAVLADDSHWQPGAMAEAYGVVSTESGEDRYRAEYEASRIDDGG
jgi:hypothetical protein